MGQQGQQTMAQRSSGTIEKRHSVWAWAWAIATWAIGTWPTRMLQNNYKEAQSGPNCRSGCVLTKQAVPRRIWRVPSLRLLMFRARVSKFQISPHCYEALSLVCAICFQCLAASIVLVVCHHLCSRLCVPYHRWHRLNGVRAFGALL